MRTKKLANRITLCRAIGMRSRDPKKTIKSNESAKKLSAWRKRFEGRSSARVIWPRANFRRHVSGRGLHDHYRLCHRRAPATRATAPGETVGSRRADQVSQ